MSVDLLDAVTGAWALVDAHLEGRDDVRFVLFDGPDAAYWRRSTDHLAEQMAFRMRREFDDRAGDVLADLRRNVLAAGRGDEPRGGF